MSNSPTFPEFEIPQPQVAAHAGQFADVAIYLYDRLHEITSAVPSVMMEGALALELFLKSLNSRTISHPHAGGGGYQLTASPNVWDHRLQVLYDAIDKPIRDELQQAYAAANFNTQVLQLRDALLPYSNLFVETRYAFESQSGGGNSITDLVNLVRFFRQHVGDMPKRFRFEWRESAVEFGA